MKMVALAELSARAAGGAIVTVPTTPPSSGPQIQAVLAAFLRSTSLGPQLFGPILAKVSAPSRRLSA